MKDGGRLVARSLKPRILDAWDQVRYQVDKRFPPDRRTLLQLLAAVVVILGIVFTIQVLQARTALSKAAAYAQVLQQQIENGDVTAAKRTLKDLQENAAMAHGKTDGFLWDIAAKVPWAGRNVDAISVVAAEIDHVSQTAIPPIVELSSDLNSKAFNPSNGRVDIKKIRSIAPAIDVSAKALAESRAELEKIDVQSLFAPLRSSVAAVQYKVTTASSVASNADIAAELLPNMLGRKGTRRYLLMFQNTAESRPTGGITGSFGVIEAKNGKISMARTGSAPDFLPPGAPVVKMTKEERSIFPSSMATDIRDVNTTPDFPRTGEIAKKLYQSKFGKRIDGVVTIDPLALSYLLSGLGPVELRKDVVVDQNNAVAALLNQVYIAFPDRGVQDDLFELTTEKVFDQFAEGAGDPTATLRGLVRAVAENRISLWSAEPKEQKLIAPTDLSGEWVDDTTRPRIGVFISDAASTKMEYFLEDITSGTPQNCLDDKRQVISLTTQLTSNAPTSGLPPTITGSGDFVRKGRMRLLVRLVSPTGGHFTSVKVDGKPTGVYAEEWQGRHVTFVEVQLKPGQSIVINANVTSAKGQVDDPMITVTPTITAQRNDFPVESACN